MSAIDIQGLVANLIRAGQAEDYRGMGEAEQGLQAAGPGAVAAILPLLHHEALEVRRRVAGMLVLMGNETAVEALSASIRDDDNFVAGNSAVALGKIGDRRAVAALIAALKHRAHGVRESAAKALGTIGDPAAGPALKEAKSDSVFGVRFAAEAALERLADRAPAPNQLEGLIAQFDSDYAATRARAATSVAMIGAAAIEPLLAAFRTGNVAVRRSVAQAFSELKDAGAIPPLVDIATRDGDKYVRREAASGLLARNDAGAHRELAQAVLRDAV